MTQYVRFISVTEVEPVPQDKNGIFNYNTNIELITHDGYKPLIEVELPVGTLRKYEINYTENEDDITESIHWLETEEEYEQRLIDERRAYLDSLSLTAADVERAIFAAKGMDFEDLIALIEERGIPGLNIKQLRIELRANNFFRNHPYINLIGTFLGYTSEDLDYLFEHKTFSTVE